MCELTRFYAQADGRGPSDVWRDHYAASALSPVWATQVSLLGRAGGDEIERRIAAEIQAWIERECPEAATAGQELVDEGGSTAAAQA